MMNTCVKCAQNFCDHAHKLVNFRREWPIFGSVERARSKLLLPLVALTAINCQVSLNVTNHDVQYFGLAG